MKLASVAALAAICATLAVAPSADSSTAPSATVENIATVLIGGVATDFEFNLYNCPAGAEMAVVQWDAEQPARPPGNGVSVGTQPFGESTGEQTQHLTLTAFGGFVAGERWVGSGTIACGDVLIPVSGSGTTKSLNGV
jgi:hypothetical protein